MNESTATAILFPYGLKQSEATALSTDRNFRKQCALNEQVLVSRFVNKINKRSREQERLILVSTEAVYNISGKTIKRKIPLSKLYAVTISRVSYEFVLHVPEEYDYRFKSQEHRDLLILYMTVAFSLQKNTGLRCFFVDQDDLDQFTLQEKSTFLEKQTQQHPKLPSQMITSQYFQLEYANRTYSVPNNYVMFIRDKHLLRAKLEDFSKQIVLGHGSLCKTYLVTQKSDSQQLLVLKTLIQQDIDMDLLELNLKMYQEHPFIETLELAFHHQNKIHFLFQLKRGGDLYQHIRQIGSFEEKQAKFIVAQIAQALKFLHEQGIVYGDLKPENILFDENGYISLTDFGYGKMRLHRQFQKKVNSLNFTPEYCPPEYLKSLELTRMADWYQLGILLYEMLFGIPPFYHATIPEITIELALQGNVHYPRNMSVSQSCQDFMTRLLISDSALRLGYQSDYKEISGHPWLQDLDIGGIIERKLIPPYKPMVSDQKINQNYFIMEQITEDDKQW